MKKNKILFIICLMLLFVLVGCVPQNSNTTNELELDFKHV